MTDQQEFLARLTFSQRYGYADLPESMQIEAIPRRFRQEVLRSIDNAINKDIDLRFDENVIYPDEFSSGRNMGRVIVAYHHDILGIYHDEISCFSPSLSRQFFRSFMKEKSWNDVLDMVQFILQHQFCSDSLYTDLINAFNRTQISYFVDESGGYPTICPRVSRESGDAAQKAVETIHEGGMDGAATHLRQAAEHINAGQYADAITDCIHAVESVARIIDPKSNTTLGPALQSLEQLGLLNHSALKQAFLNLYGYTSDEQGLRHALLDKDAADVGLDEAMFMYGACASFAAYLTQKHRQAGGA